ncbi:MAG: GNAT family N-acetyltransferase [Myxococcota bacterium]|nr:GNAT family N-acetyltransferase [Myxococcota bacterium]
MEWLNYDDLDERSLSFNRGVWSTPHIDHFCSSTYWVLPAVRHFEPDCAPFIFTHDDTFGAFMTIEQGRGLTTALPLECGWGLAAPLIGADPDRSIGLLASAWRQRTEIDAIILAGLPPQPPWLHALSARFDRQCRIGLGERCIRRLASLSGGVDGFLSRRSAKFRRNLKAARRQVHEAGIRFESASTGTPNALFDRILEIEAHSWKGRLGEGLDQRPSCDFYRDMVHRLRTDNACRLLFARQGERDVGFIFGAVVAQRYRGLQMSFDHTLKSLGLGNCLQYEMIELLCAEEVDIYDLGTDMPYKARWAEATFETAIIALLPG